MLFICIYIFRYKFLDSKFVGKSLAAVIPKLAVDALVVTPINLTLFYVGKSCFFFLLKYINNVMIIQIFK